MEFRWGRPGWNCRSLMDTGEGAPKLGSMAMRIGNWRLIFAFGLAVICGVFLAVASEALHWSNASVATVGFALAALLGLLGTPLVLLPFALPSTDGGPSGPSNHGGEIGRGVRPNRNAELNAISLRLAPTGPQFQVDTSLTDWTLYVDPIGKFDRQNLPSKREGLLQIDPGSPQQEPTWVNQEQNQFDYDFRSYLRGLGSSEDGFGDTDDSDQEDEIPMASGAR
jgi:hypothetical protein